MFTTYVVPTYRPNPWSKSSHDPNYGQLTFLSFLTPVDQYIALSPVTTYNRNTEYGNITVTTSQVPEPDAPVDPHWNSKKTKGLCATHSNFLLALISSGDRPTAASADPTTLLPTGV